jgi:hypothetical protein
MELRAGQKLHSAVCEAQFVVVRAPAGDVDVQVGGAAALDHEPGDAERAELDPSVGDAPQMGKRYADEEVGIELLCARPGKGAVTVNGVVLPLKGAKPLPSSD